MNLITERKAKERKAMAIAIVVFVALLAALLFLVPYDTTKF
ncbi:MAG: hypothetical protein ACE5FE_00775 [Acidiferrobacterales bacterium]